MKAGNNKRQEKTNHQRCSCCCESRKTKEKKNDDEIPSDRRRNIGSPERKRERESFVHTIVSTDYGLCLLVFSQCVGKWRHDFLLWVLDPNWIQPASIDHVVVVVVASLFFFSPAIQTNSHSDDRSRSSTTRHWRNFFFFFLDVCVGVGCICKDGCVVFRHEIVGCIPRFSSSLTFFFL